MKYNARSTGLSVGRSVCVYTLLRILFYPLAFHVSEFRNEVSDYLTLSGNTWVVLYVEIIQLRCL